MKFRDRLIHHGRQREQIEGELGDRVGFFDPRFDLPKNEFTRLQQLPLGPSGTSLEKQRIFATAWVSWLESDHLERIRAVPGILELELDLFHRIWGDRKTVGKVPSDLTMAAEIITVFPQAREELCSVAEKDLNALLAKATDQAMDTIRTHVVHLIQLFPQRRQELLERTFGRGELRSEHMGEYLEEVINNPAKLTVRAARCILIFPEERPRILHMIQTKERQMVARATHITSRWDDPALFLSSQRYFGDLTILSAEQAWIDEEGRVQVQMKSGHAGPVPNLPVRPTV